MKNYKVTIFDTLQNAIGTDTFEAANKQVATEKAKEIMARFAVGAAYRLDVVGVERGIVRPVTKAGVQHGVCTQSKSFTFRLDDDIAPAFRAVLNKGRLINNLLREALIGERPTLDARPDQDLASLHDRRP